MATSAAQAIFERQLLELRLSGALLSAFRQWTNGAIVDVLNDQAARRFLRDQVLATIPDDLVQEASDYFDTLAVIDDAIEVLTDIRDYARTACRISVRVASSPSPVCAA